MLGLGDGLAGRRFEGVEVVRAFSQVDHVPSVGRETRWRVVAQRQFGRPIDGDVIVVVEHRQAIEAQGAREGRGLVADALFEAAVTRDDPGAVIDEVGAVVGAQDSLGEGHADPVGHALAQGTGRDLDGRRHAVLGMPRGARVGLAELPQVLDREVVAEEVREAVLQDRDVSAAEDEAVSVGPRRVARVVAQHSREQHRGQGRQRHRGSAVARVGGRGRVHRQGGDVANRAPLQLVGSGVHGVAHAPKATEVTTPLRVASRDQHDISGASSHGASE